MNTSSYDCHRKPDNCDPSELKQIGDFNWRFLPHLDNGRILGMAIVMPNVKGNGKQTYLRVVLGPAPAEKIIWGWDGNLDKPTLEPSLLDENQWHGHMKAGRLVSC